MTNNARPNILLLTSDQQHWFTLGCLNPEIKTPNLDRLAAAGTLFTRAYCPNPTCTPTRASMITGLYPSQHGAWSLGTKLPEDVPTLGDLLSRRGYRTALVGKAHFQQLLDHPHYRSIESNPLQQNLDFWRAFHGPFYGFEHVELARNHGDEYHVGQHYALWMEDQGFSDWRDCFRKPAGNQGEQYGRWNLPEAYHYDAWIAERSCALMAEYAAAREPFLLWASFLDPHPPYVVPEPWDTLYDPADLTLPTGQEGEHARNPPPHQLTQMENPDFSPWREDGFALHGYDSHLKLKPRAARNMALYYGMISLMDKYIGRILDQLDALNLTDQTVVVFTTDHGHLFGQHNLYAKGAFHYEDLLKVPFLAAWPGMIPAGTRSAALQSLVDLAPTFLSLTGSPIPRTMTGRDQSAVWRGEQEQARDHVIVENHHEPTTIHLRTLINQRYKLTVYYNQSYGELFDLQEDPGEHCNLWAEPSAQDLKARLLLELVHAELGKEPLWMPRVWGA